MMFSDPACPCINATALVSLAIATSRGPSLSTCGEGLKPTRCFRTRLMARPSAPPRGSLADLPSVRLFSSPLQAARHTARSSAERGMQVSTPRALRAMRRATCHHGAVNIGAMSTTLCAERAADSRSLHRCSPVRGHGMSGPRQKVRTNRSRLIATVSQEPLCRRC